MTDIFHFDDWVMNMLSNSDYNEMELMEFREHYENLLDFNINAANFIIFNQQNIMQNKKEFDYYIDTKCTIWCRERYKVEADSKEEADKIMKDVIINGDYRIGLINDSEYLYETIEEMSIVDNDGYATKELYESNLGFESILITTNKKN